jgi:NAD(P)-dependent dehydrogenase (short-subunit alcohol dehydrogenase family)
MTCLISGGGSGIGRASALLIARRMPVIIVDCDSRGINESVALVSAQGGMAVGIKCDVRLSESCVAAVAAAEEIGPLTDVVTAAGVLSRDDRALGECSPETWDNVLGINLTGTANVVRAALPALERAGGGDIVLVSSNAALVGRPGIAAYTVSKVGLLGLHQSIVADYSRCNIRCNTVCPGPTATPMARPPDRLLNAKGRMAQPIEVAAVIDWLTCDESSWLIGAVLPVDAGETCVVSKVWE